MRSKRDAVEYLGHVNGIDGAPKSSRSPENEEWAWMVAEDPAFYLAKAGRVQENTGT